MSDELGKGVDKFWEMGIVSGHTQADFQSFINIPYG